MTQYFMGVDPGMTGAAAFINDRGAFACFLDYPGSASVLAAQIRLLLISDQAGTDSGMLHQIPLAVIEHVHTMPKQGIASSGKFMKNAGIWEGVLAATIIPYELISPQRWRKILDSSVPSKPTKDDLRQYVMKRWPLAASQLTRQKDHNRSEALLLAEYARLKYLGKIL